MKAIARLVRERDVFLWVVNRCPYCGRRHTHGGGPLDGDPRVYLGHRVAHCFGTVVDDGYILVEGRKDGHGSVFCR